MQFLTYVQEILKDRRTAYGPPAQNFKEIAQRWSITLGQDITPVQVALCMLDLKLTRLRRNPRHQDNLVDIAGYVACLAEVLKDE